MVIKSINEQIRQAKLGDLSAQERVLALMARGDGLEKERAATLEDTVQRRRVDEKIAGNNFELLKARNEAGRQHEARITKALEDQGKLEERKKQIAFDKLTLDEKISKLQKDDRELTKIIADDKKKHITTTAEETRQLDIQAQIRVG